MKKLSLILLMAAVAALAAACAAGAAAGSTPSSTAGSAPQSEPEPTQPEELTAADNASQLAEGQSSCDPKFPKPRQSEEWLEPEGASLYRGVVTGITSGEAESDRAVLWLTVDQADGTNFGVPNLQFAVSNDTETSFDTATLNNIEGNYIEVYYYRKTRDIPSAGERIEAAAVNNYGNPLSVLTGGTVVAVDANPQSPGSGSLLVLPLDGSEGMEIRFLYDENTVFNLNPDELEPGDKLSILHSSAMTLSLPPQCRANEISRYYEPQA